MLRKLVFFHCLFERCLIHLYFSLRSAEPGRQNLSAGPPGTSPVCHFGTRWITLPPPGTEKNIQLGLPENIPTIRVDIDKGQSDILIKAKDQIKRKTRERQEKVKPKIRKGEAMHT